MWDLRARACVQDYRGHVNEITHGLRFYVDPTDSLIFAGKASLLFALIFSFSLIIFPLNISLGEFGYNKKIIPGFNTFFLDSLQLVKIHWHVFGALEVVNWFTRFHSLRVSTNHSAPFPLCTTQRNGVEKEVCLASFTVRVTQFIPTHTDTKKGSVQRSLFLPVLMGRKLHL